MLSLTSISGNIADPFWASLQSVNDLFKNQVLIDEVADFASVQLGCMSALAHPRIRSVFACGDFNQRVTSWGTRSLDEVRMVIPDVDVRRITTTYRQSRRLNELAKAIVEAFGGSGDIAIVPADIDFDGVSPALIEKCSEQKQIVAWIADRIREIERELRKLPSIAIFVRQDDDIQPLAEDLNRALEDSNILVEACRDGKVVGQETAVRIFAVEYIKGLEFESVFFVGVDQLMETYPDLYDKYLYVGATRAATYLGFTCEKKLPEPLSRLRSIFVEMWT
jgi:DNA helicase IV